MTVLLVGDSLFKYLRINRTGSDVRFSSGARIEELPNGMSDITQFQVRFYFYFYFFLIIASVFRAKLKL